MFDAQTLVLLCMLHFDKRDSKEFNRAYANLELLVNRRPDSTRLQRFLGVCKVFHLLNARKVGECVALVKELASDIRREDFDYESATNLLAMLARLRNTEIQLPDAEMWAEHVSQRFCVSKASCELLCSAAGNDEVYAGIIRDGHHSISGMAEKAMAGSVNGCPKSSVEALLSKGSETRNAKLIDLAKNVLVRHAEKIGDTSTLSGKIDDLKHRFCTKGTQVSLGLMHGRAAGGLSLRA
jgi:hypothetical protein